MAWFGKKKDECNHRWDVISDQVLEAISQEMLVGVTLKNVHMSDILQKKHIVILRCSVCNKIRKVVTSLF